MSISIFCKVLGLVLWFIAAFINRFAPQASAFNLVAAGLFFFFLPDVLQV